MAWRPARSLDVLLAEVNTLAPNRSKRSDGTIGDTAHQASASDHNPNSRNVVCARDITHDPARGADMNKISKAIVAANPPALKYLIWNMRIYFPGFGWSAYYVSNPHDKHMHASVGHGPDGASTGNYDDTSPWGLAEGDDVNLDDKLAVSDHWKTLYANDPGIADGSITVQTALVAGYLQARYGKDLTAEVLAEQRAAKARDLAILDALKGDKDTAAILAHIDALAEQDRTRDQDLLTAVREMASGGATADQIVDVLAERLSHGTPQ